MKEIIYKNGYKGIYDDELKPGDLITAYQKGYHEFIAYEDRGPKQVPLILYKRKFDSNGKPSKSKVLTCDAAYCRLAKDKILKEIKNREEQIENLKNIIWPPND